MRALDLEQLLATPVTSVKRKEDSLARTAGAVYVITQEELRRFGVTSIPEALRLVPGMNVARVSLTSWAVSARGFNGGFANKLLVMIDGRTVYSPIFGGVHWDSQDAMIEDVDRIEVMRGPGAAMWGANAVNGVVNIITKTSQRTQGTQVTVGTGTQDQALTRIRHGAAAGRHGFYRTYAQHTLRVGDASEDPSLGLARWSFLQGGFRGDWTPTDSDSLTVQGDTYRSGTKTANHLASFKPPYSEVSIDRGEMTGANVMSRWERTHRGGGTTSVQSYFDHYGRESGLINYTVRTLDADLQHRRPLGSRHELVMGAGARSIWDQTRTSRGFSFGESTRQYGLVHFTLQDEVTLRPERLALTGGVRLERNSFTGWSVQPTARLLYTPSKRQTLWAAVSHAVRTPSRGELSLNLLLAVQPGPGGLPVAVQTDGLPSLRNELGNAAELGHRWQWRKRWMFDSTVFYSRTNGAAQLVTGRPTLQYAAGGPYLLAPLSYANGLQVGSSGFESAVRFEAARRWRLAGNYTFLHVKPRSMQAAAGPALDPLAIIHNSSPHQFSVRSEWNPRRRWEFDTAYFWYAGLIPSSYAIGRHQRLDARLGWAMSEFSELSVGVQNLLSPRRIEFPKYIGPAPAPQAPQMYVRMGFRF
ncbi:MAG: TonB-dependent receptor [Acidobacteria bacterium]|nr:TonB-dependent receptor [Acidobacteriota bacterium]